MSARDRVEARVDARMARVRQNTASIHLDVLKAYVLIQELWAEIDALEGGDAGMYDTLEALNVLGFEDTGERLFGTVPVVAMKMYEDQPKPEGRPDHVTQS